MLKTALQRGGRILALGLAAASCGDPGESADPGGVTSHKEPINGVEGVANLVNSQQNGQAPYNSVVQISGFSVECSAVKVRNGTRDRFLTAAHCVDFTSQRIGITASLDGRTSDVGRDIRAIFRHPSCRADPNTGSLCTNSRSTSYDVAIFEVDNIPGIPALSTNRSYVGSGVTSRQIGYGCNLLEPDWQDPTTQEWPKQQATNTSSSRGAISVARYTRYLHNSGVPSGCLGDSGGPLVATTSPFGIRGINSHNLGDEIDGTTHYARVSNLWRWIAEPNKLNTVVSLEVGFFQNQAAIKCMTVDSAGNTSLGECDGRDQPIDVQYWQLIRVDGHYQIMNTLHGKCLSTSGSTIIHTMCVANDRRQHWTLSVQILADPAPSYMQAINRLSGQYLARSANANETPLRMTNFGFGDTTQRWYFYP